jgi:hypothetical protein
VLLASGYIAGGAIAGIVIAIFAAGMSRFDKAVTDWSTANNPFFSGANSDLLALVPYALLVGFLYLVAREKLLTPTKK